MLILVFTIILIYFASYSNLIMAQHNILAIFYCFDDSCKDYQTKSKELKAMRKNSISSQNNFCTRTQLLLVPTQITIQNGKALMVCNPSTSMIVMA